MKKKDKELLLKDLCARLPYGVICTDLRHGDSKITEVDTEDGLVYCFDFDEYVKLENCHLYLRPMSSMMDEEHKEYNSFSLGEDWVSNRYMAIPAFRVLDWLNKHHFDYSGLIEKGLALEAPEDVLKQYKTQKNGL